MVAVDRSRLTLVGAVAALGGTVHTAYNLRRLRQPVTGEPCAERVSVLLPLRDEVGHVRACPTALLGQVDVGDLEILVLDDGSVDGTGDLVRSIAATDDRVRLLDGGSDEPPPGWLGKPWACERLARAAGGSVLVFVDADVVLEPHAVADTVASLRAWGLDLVSPYPRQVCGSAAERLVQPLLQWSWLTLLPLGVAERSGRSSLAAANGQLLAVDAGVYRRAGGHAAAPGAVLDDLELLRSVKRAGGRGTVIDGTHLAACRMYEGWDQLSAGYQKSLWAAFGSPAGAAAVVAGLSVAYVLPFGAMLRGSRTGAVGYFAGVAGRVLVARRVGGRVWPDSLAHPVSVVALGYLTATSLRRHRAGTLAWKGRRVP
jgi:hypothetical protein